jgi:hypothetical protein
VQAKQQRVTSKASLGACLDLLIFGVGRLEACWIKLAKKALAKRIGAVKADSKAAL